MSFPAPRPAFVLDRAEKRKSFLAIDLRTRRGMQLAFRPFSVGCAGARRSVAFPKFIVSLPAACGARHSSFCSESRRLVRRYPPLGQGSRTAGSARAMATDGKKFPSQQQEEQPGLEHEMQPAPEFVRRNYKPADKLLGKVAIVTGGDSGIGRSVACHFALEGATVAITYVPEKEERDASEILDLLKTKYKHPQAKAEPIKIAVDLGFDENCKKVVDKVIEAYGCIDILVNNAAEQYMVPGIEEMSSEQLERVFRTNIFSHFYLTKHAINHMKKGSSIINTTSVNAYKGNASLLDYTSTKGAIVAFTRGLALHLVDRGIRVNGVAPGPIWTPLIPSSFPPEKVEGFGEQVPMKRAGQPSEVGPSYVFLASEDASYYSGQVLHPNGGVVVNA